MAWKLVQKEYTSGNQGLSSHSEETNKVRFLEFLVSWKNSISNDVHAQNKTLLAVRNELLLPPKIRVAEGGDILFVH